MSVKIIGLGHKARQGKMRAAKAIHCAIPERSWICSFADALKAHCRVNHGMTSKDSALLQREGCRMRKEVDPDIWFRVLGHSIEEFAPDVEDVRDGLPEGELRWGDYSDGRFAFKLADPRPFNRFVLRCTAARSSNTNNGGCHGQEEH